MPDRVKGGPRVIVWANVADHPRKPLNKMCHPATLLFQAIKRRTRSIVSQYLETTPLQRLIHRRMRQRAFLIFNPRQIATIKPSVAFEEVLSLV
jgi:hypothetical protein